MKTMILVAFAALSLTAAIANAASFGQPTTPYHQGPYDNTANSLNRSVIGGD